MFVNWPCDYVNSGGWYRWLSSSMVFV